MHLLMLYKIGMNDAKNKKTLKFKSFYNFYNIINNSKLAVLIFSLKKCECSSEKGQVVKKVKYGPLKSIILLFYG